MRAPSPPLYWRALWWASPPRTRTSTASGCWLAAWYDLGVPRCGGAFTPSTRVVSRRGGRGWFLFDSEAIRTASSDRDAPRRARSAILPSRRRPRRSRRRRSRTCSSRRTSRSGCGMCVQLGKRTSGRSRMRSLRRRTRSPSWGRTCRRRSNDELLFLISSCGFSLKIRAQSSAVRGRVLSQHAEHVLHTQILQKVIGQPIRVVRATWAQAQAVQNNWAASLTPSVHKRIAHTPPTRPVTNGPSRVLRDGGENAPDGE